MSVGRFVECRGYYFGVDATLHVGHFLGAFVDEENHDIGFGVILGNGVRDIFKEQGLTGLGRGYDQTSLTFAYRREHVDDPCGHGA